MGISLSSAKILAQKVLTDQRLKLATLERVGNVEIVRYSGPNNAIIGSITLTPALLEMNEADATNAIFRMVMESVRAACSEPAIRQKSEEVQKSRGQELQLASPSAANMSAPSAPSIPGVPVEEIPGGKIE